MTGCDWQLGAGADEPYPRNGAILLVAKRVWPMGAAEVYLDGQVQASSRVVHPMVMAANAVMVVRPHLGANVVTTGNLVTGQTCVWVIQVTEQEDNEPPGWRSGLSQASADRSGRRQSAVGIPVWSGEFTETSWLVAWDVKGGSPLWIFPPGEGARTSFGVYPAGVEAYSPKIIPRPRDAFVVRPMDNAGNLGDAWRVDPVAHTAARLDDPSSYVWVELAGALRPPPVPGAVESP